MQTDLDLLNRYHRHGDAEAFQSLVVAHAGMVHATACRVTRDAMLAQDVAQETFLALARSSGAAIQSVGAWLHHVAWQKALNTARGESRRRDYEAAAAEQWPQAQAEATWADLEPVLDEALSKLAPQPKAMLIARYFEGRDQTDIARQHGVSQATVSRLLERGIADLRSRLKDAGILCGAGLAALLATHSAQAAPPALLTTLGKLALSGVGTATGTLTFTQTIAILLMTPAAKLTLAAAVVVAAAALGNDLASSDSTVRRLFSNAPASPAATPTPSATNSVTQTASRHPTSPAHAPAASAVHPLQSAVVRGPSAQMLSKLAALKKQEDFKAFVLRLFASKDPARISAMLREEMGLAIPPDTFTRNFPHPNHLETLIVSQLAIQHPEEALAWLVMFEGTSNLIAANVYRQVFSRHTHITAESLASTLPAGANREHVLGILRAQRDPVTEANRMLAMPLDAKARQNQLWQLASLWPAHKASDGIHWAMTNLPEQERTVFVPELMQQLSLISPEQTLAFLTQVNDPKLLALTIGETLNGLVSKHRRPGDLVPIISKLEGVERDYAISALAKAWVSVDQTTLMQWLNTVESPADFDAMLPSTLPQLSEANYQSAITTLMTQLDPGLEAALIKTALPNTPQSTRTTMDIISRLTALPQYGPIGAGRTGNQELLWQAVNQNAAGWVSKQGASPAEGARWIDSLSFRTPNDKILVAGKLYQQWKLSDPAAAARWAQSTGVAVR